MSGRLSAVASGYRPRPARPPAAPAGCGGVEVLARLHDVRSDCAGGESALADVFELAPLAQVEGDGDHLGAVVLDEPGDGHRAVETAGIGEDDFHCYKRPGARGRRLGAKAPSGLEGRRQGSQPGSRFQPQLETPSVSPASDDVQDAAREQSGAARVARDDENRVVAGDRADRFRQLRAVDGDRERLRLPDAGAQMTTSCCTRSTRRRNSAAARSSALSAAPGRRHRRRAR